jgi:two-component system OmpR family sensor kinase
VALFIARSISRPLAEITRAAEGMAKGDYNQQIKVRGHDEVGRVASTFNVMAQQIARSNRTLRDFLADVSHELRTPLTTIEGFSQAILDGTAADPASVEECARIIKEDADRMQRMVEDLLYLSRIESGQQSMDLQQVDLVPIVEGAVKRARQRTSGQTLDLETNGHAQLVRADAHRVDQVLDNLLTNALNHTPSDGRINVQVLSQAGEERVRVHNTGSYVALEDRDRIFERFWRANGDGSGSGLGLSIAQQIARSHGGRIDLDSSPEQGTAFTLVLPTGTARSFAD